MQSLIYAGARKRNRNRGNVTVMWNHSRASCQRQLVMIRDEGSSIQIYIDYTAQKDYNSYINPAITIQS